jgi:hypothetical protein
VVGELKRNVVEQVRGDPRFWRMPGRRVLGPLSALRPRDYGPPLCNGRSPIFTTSIFTSNAPKV